MALGARTPVSCGIDIGSTNLKVAAIDADGRVVARVSRRTPRTDALTIDGDTVMAVIEDMMIEACADRFEVHAVCTAGVGEDGVILDSSFSTLIDALPWYDSRRTALYASLPASIRDDETVDAHGSPAWGLVGWGWARAQIDMRDDLQWVALADLPGVVWSGRAYMSDTLASRTGAWRATTRAWDPDRVGLTLGTLDHLPPVVGSGEVVGTLRARALQSAGVLVSDAITVAGGHDHPIGGWGADQLSPGCVLDSMGTAEVVVARAQHPALARTDHIDVSPAIRSAGTTMLRVEELARNVDWASRDADVARHLRSLLAGLSDPLDVLDSGFFVPGRRGAPPGYSRDAPTDPRARAGAVLGALSRLGRDAVNDVRQHAAAPGPVLMAGGWARSPGWLRVKETVSGYDAVPITEQEVTAVSAALLAAHARGWSPGAETALNGAARPSR